MSILTYFPRVFSGLVDPKNKQAALERVQAVFAEGNIPTFVAGYKNTSSFAFSGTNEPSGTIVRHSGLQLARRHTALGRDAVAFSALDSQKQENLYVSAVSTQTLKKVSGFQGTPVAMVALSQNLAGALSGANTAIAITADGLFAISSKDVAGSETIAATKAKIEGAEVLKSIRAFVAGDDGFSVILNSTNEVQVWKFSKTFTSASKVFETQIAGLGVVFTKLVGNHLYVVSNSGSLLSRWSIDDGADTKVFERKFDAPITSIYADSEYVIVGHPKNVVELLEASDLVAVASYTCSEDPEDVPQTNSVNQKGNSDLFQSFKDLVLNVDRYGDYIIGANDRTVCVWSISLKKIFNPIKLRVMKGKIVTKLLVDKSSDSVSIYAAVSRTNAESEAKSGDGSDKISPKDLRVDIMSWKIPSESIKKAEQRRLRDAEYQQALSNLLSRSVTNSLMQDVGFAHRMFHVSQSARYDAAFIKSLVDVSTTIRRLPVYLTAAVDENLKELEGRKAIAAAGFQMAGFSFPLPLSTFLLHRTSLNCSIMCDFMLREGEGFIKAIWGSLFRKLKRASSEAWECNHRVLYLAQRKSGMEKETKRQLRKDAKQQAADNSDKVIEWTKRFLDQLFAAEAELPGTIKQLLKYFFARARQTITDELSDAIIKNGPMELLIHDFLVPVIVAPSLFGILDKIDYQVQMNLGQIGKMVDHIGLRKIDADHPLAEYAQKAFEFVCRLVGVDPVRAASRKSKRQVVEAPTIRAKPKNIKPGRDSALMTQSYYNVSEFIVDNSAALSEASESDNFALEAETSVLLQKLAKYDSIKAMKGKENCTVFCVPSSDEDRHDGLEHDLKFFSGGFEIQEDLSSYKRGRGLRSASADDIPFSNLLAVDPRQYNSTREWLLEESKHHSFLVVIFYRGAMCPFCSRYMRAWNKYVESVLKRDGLIIAVSSQTQVAAKKNIAEWQASYPSIGDPYNELATMFGVEIEKHPFFKHGMTQPAILGLSRTGEALYFWKSAAALGSIMGATDRPRPYKVLESIVYELKKPKTTYSSSLIETITRQTLGTASEVNETADSSTSTM